MFSEKIDKALEWFCIILIVVLPLTAIGLQAQRPLTGFGYSQISEGSFMPGNRAEYPFNEYGIREFNDTIATDNITGYFRPKPVYAYSFETSTCWTNVVTGEKIYGIPDPTGEVWEGILKKNGVWID